MAIVSCECQRLNTIYGVPWRHVGICGVSGHQQCPDNGVSSRSSSLENKTKNRVVKISEPYYQSGSCTDRKWGVTADKWSHAGNGKTGSSFKFFWQPLQIFLDKELYDHWRTGDVVFTTKGKSFGWVQILEFMIIANFFLLEIVYITGLQPAAHEIVLCGSWSCLSITCVVQRLHDNFGCYVLYHLLWIFIRKSREKALC